MSHPTTNHNVHADFDAAFAKINIAPTAAMDATLTDANNGDPPTTIGLRSRGSLLEHNSVTPLTLVLHSTRNSSSSKLIRQILT